MSKEPHIVQALLVEDDDEDAAIFCRYMRRLRSHRVVIERVASAEEAISRLAGTRFDLIFLDLNLGARSDGIDLLNRLHADGVNVPAIMVTATGDEIKAVEAMKAGAYDYLVKDLLSPDLLERTIRNARTRYALERERARMVEKLAEMSITDELTGLANRLKNELGVTQVAPAHCTGHLAFKILMSTYGDDFIRAGLGSEIRF